MAPFGIIGILHKKRIAAIFFIAYGICKTLFVGFYLGNIMFLKPLIA